MLSVNTQKVDSHLEGGNYWAFLRDICKKGKDSK